MCPHETLPELTMVWHIEMQQLVYNDVVRQLAIKREEVCAKVQLSSSGARSPLVAHGPNRKRARMHTELVGPLAHARLELIFVAPAFHVIPLRFFGARRRCCPRARRPYPNRPL